MQSLVLAEPLRQNAAEFQASMFPAITRGKLAHRHSGDDWAAHLDRH